MAHHLMLRWLAATLLVAAVLVCTVPADAQPKVTIEFWYAYPSVFDPVVKELVERFQQQHPHIRVEASAVGKDYEEITQKMQARFFAGTPPTLALHGFTYARYFAEHAPAIPLQQFVDRDADFRADDFAPAMLALGRFGGRIVALPFAVSTPIVYYNADLFRKAGLDPRTPPDTWQDLDAAAQRLTRPAEGQHGVWFHWNITGNWLFQAMVSCAGGRMMAPDERRVAFNEPPGVKALSFWASLTARGSMPKLASFQTAEASFTAGKLGMLVTSTAFLAQLERSTQGRFELGTGPFPRDVERRVPAGGNAVFMFTRDPVQQEAAWRFAKWITSPQGTTIMSKGTGYMPVRKSVLEDATLMRAYLEERPRLRATMRQIDVMEPWYTFPGDQGTRITDIVKNAIESALLGQKEPKPALDEAARQATTLLPRKAP